MVGPAYGLRTVVVVVDASQDERDVPYEPPALVELGSAFELTLGAYKAHGPADGFLFRNKPLVITSA